MKKLNFIRMTLLIIFTIGVFLPSNAVSYQSGYGEETTLSIVDFIADKTEGIAPLAVNFTYTYIARILKYEWKFGDGETSQEKNPTHTFNAPGTYNVSLTITYPGGKNTATKEIYVYEDAVDIPDNDDDQSGYGNNQTGYGETGYGANNPNQNRPPDDRSRRRTPREVWGTNGSVRYITGFELKDTNTDCAYLIITHSDFFETAALHGFANYRADYSNFKVVIAKVDDIYAEFSNPNGNDYSIKDFIQYAYDNWQTKPMYLLIVGDAEFVPSHPGPTPYPEYEVADDQWYACVSGEDADIAIGRFPVKNEDHIWNITDKIFAYEQEPFSPADGSALYAGRDSDWATLLKDRGFDVTQLSTEIDGKYVVVISDVITAINNGQNIVYWYDHGAPTGIGTIFNVGDIGSLYNSHYPIIFANSCHTAHFSNRYECLGEELLRADGIGAVAYYGSYTSSWWRASDEIMDMIFTGGEYNLGQAIMNGEIKVGGTNHLYLLLGDPALQVFGYKLNKTLPDIVSSSITYDYNTKKLRISLANIGSVDAYDALTRVNIIDSVTGEKTPCGDYTFGTMPAGKTESADIEPPPLRKYFAEVIVDPENKIEESFELNNQTVQSVIINSPPVISPIDPKIVDEGTLFNLTIDVSDPDGDNITMIIEAPPKGSYFNKYTRILRWRPDYRQAGVWVLRVIATDKYGATDTETVTITVYDVNRPPIILPIYPKEVKYEKPLWWFIVEFYDPDGDNVTIEADNLPEGAEFYSPWQTWWQFEWTPNSAQVGVYKVTFTATDEDGATDTETVTITVYDTDPTPQIIAASYVALGGLSTSFEEITLEDLELGKTYSVKEEAGEPFIAVNKNPAQTVNIKIEPKLPEDSSLVDGYEPIPDLSWVEIEKCQFENVKPNEEAETDITITIPNDEKYSGKKYQLDMFSYTIGDALFRMEHTSRILLHVSD